MSQNSQIKMAHSQLTGVTLTFLLHATDLPLSQSSFLHKMRQHGEHGVMRRLHDQMHPVSSWWIYGLLEKNEPLQVTPLACSWSEDCGLLLELTGFVKSLFPQSALLPTMPSFMQRAGRRWTWRQAWHAESQIKTDYFWDAETRYPFRRSSRDAALNDTWWAQRRSLCPNSAFCMTSSRLKKSFVTEQEQQFTDSLCLTTA